MNIQKELEKFCKGEVFEDIIGNIVIKAVNQALTKEVLMEDGKSEPGRVIEKTKTVNALEFLMGYLPHVEGAIRGCQSDSAQARNRSAEVKHALNQIPVLHLAEGVLDKLKELPE
jgi:hypothetical protein